MLAARFQTVDMKTVHFDKQTPGAFYSNQIIVDPNLFCGSIKPNIRKKIICIIITLSAEAPPLDKAANVYDPSSLSTSAVSIQFIYQEYQNRTF